MLAFSNRKGNGSYKAVTPGVVCRRELFQFTTGA